MLIAGSALKGYAIEASDGRLGSVKTVLFDDQSWNIRWLVIDTGHWLSGRQVLVHPSAIAQVDVAAEALHLALTKAQIEASPDIERDQPVTMQMESQLHSYYGWDPYRAPNFYGAGLIGAGTMGLGMPGLGVNGGYGGPSLSGQQEMAEDTIQMRSDDGDPHLRSMSSVTGYHILATDGEIGHVENFLIEDTTWSIRYLIIDTQNWWPGEHVLMSPYAVKSIDYTNEQVQVTVTRAQVKSNPSWDPAKIIDEAYERQLHGHYGWPGYGW